MARIRTIKPEFPQSESMGRVSREARLLFVMMWTIADDAGRLRASSRLLASLLYPYDDDAPALVDGWMDELEREQCVRRYTVEGTTYAELINWLDHQKIDRPTESRLPPHSRTIANPREPSSTDLGPRTKDQERETRARDSASLISEEAATIAQAINPEAIGLQYAAQTWINEGIPRDFILSKALPVVHKPLNYIAKTVRSSWAEHCAAPTQTESSHAKPRKQSAIMEALDQHIRNLGGDEEGEDFGVGEGSSRLLSHGRG